MNENLTVGGPSSHDKLSIVFNSDRSITIEHRVGDKSSTFSVQYPESTKFANAFVRAYCGPGVEPFIRPLNESIEVSTILARTALRRMGMDGLEGPGSWTYVNRLSDLALAFSLELRERWGVR